MTHHCNIQLRFADTDALGHINNAAYAHYAETARIVFCQDAGIPVNNLILARLELDFIKQVKFGESLCVKSQVEKVGNSSVTMQQTVLVSGEAACSIRSVVVHFDYKANKSMRVPDDVRAKLEPYLINLQANT